MQRTLKEKNWEKYGNKFGLKIIVTGLTIEPDTLLAGIYPALF